MMTKLNSSHSRVLSALIDARLSNEKKQEVIDRLKPEYFIDPVQNEIFTAIRSLIESGQDSLPYSVWEAFPESTELFSIVQDYCLSLSEFGLCANVDVYADEVITEAGQSEIGRDMRQKIHDIYHSNLSEIEKRNALEDAIDISKEQSQKLTVEEMPNLNAQRQIMSDCILKPVPETEFVFNNQMIPMEELTVLPGFNGSGKSFLSLQLSIAKAMGKTFMVDDKGGLYFDPVKQGRVLILSVEDESKHYAKRCQDIIKHFPSITEKDKQAIINNLFFRSFSELGLDGQLTTKDPKTLVIEKSYTWRKVKKFIIDGGFELVVIDPLHYCINAGDENSNADMGQAVQVLIQLAKETGAAILSPCHTSETNPLKPRGATSITDRSRSMLTLATISRLIEKKAVCSMPNLNEIKCDMGSALRFAMAKNSHGNLMSNYWMFERMTGGVMVPMLVKSEQVDIENIIIEILGDIEMTQPNLIKEIGIEHDIKMSNRSIENRIKLMVEAGILHCQKTPKLNTNILSVNASKSDEFYR